MSKRKENDAIIESQLKYINTELKDGVFIFTSPMKIGDFSEKIKKPASEIIAYFFKKGNMFNINHILNEETIAELCLEYEYDFKKENEVNAQNFMDHVIIKDDKKSLKSRPPIITVMGHVDHGKTSLIDKIRNSSITSNEKGGITQHTGAYQIEYEKHKITFLDTPGHEAFTAMRARGAKITDIVIIVVSADDGVMTQTKEAIDHALNAKVPIIIFINKMDKPHINPQKVINDLATNNVVVEEIGGDVQCVKGSAINGDGINELLSSINLQAEMLDLKANPNRMPIGVVIESRVDKGRGVVSTLIVQNGSLHSRDFIVAGSHYGRIRTMENTLNKKIDKVFSGTPIIITGLNYMPKAGDNFFGSSDEKFAKKLASQKGDLDKEDELKERTLLKIEGDKKVLNVLIKADVQGTAEAIKYSLSGLENEEAKVNIIRTSVGMITKSDIVLAQASQAIILGFNIRPNSMMKNEAKSQNVEIRSYSVIYKMIEDVKNIIKGMQAPKYEEKITGEAIIQKIIYFSKVGNIAGCMMNSGEINTGSKIRLIREGRVIYEGEIDSLQRGKNTIKKVEIGKDFGTHIKNYNDIKEGDFIEAYIMKEIKI